MYCKNCGAKLVVDSIYCMECGAIVKKPEEELKGNKKKWKKSFIAGMAGICAITGILAGGLTACSGGEYSGDLGYSGNSGNSEYIQVDSYGNSYEYSTGYTNTDNFDEVNYSVDVFEDMETQESGDYGYDTSSKEVLWDLEGHWYPVDGFYLNANLVIKELSDDEIWLTAYFAPTAEVVYDGAVKLYPDYKNGNIIETAKPITGSPYDRAMKITIKPEEDHIVISDGIISGRYEKD